VYNIFIGSTAQLAIKVSPFGGEYDGAKRRSRIRSCGGGDAYHYSFVVQTYSSTGCKPLLVRSANL